MALIVQHPSITGQTQSNKKSYPIEKSSWIMSVDYDSSNLLATITTKRGDQYNCFFTWPNTIEEFVKSPSKGSFVSKLIFGKGATQRIVNKNVGKQVSKKK